MSFWVRVVMASSWSVEARGILAGFVLLRFLVVRSWWADWEVAWIASRRVRTRSWFGCGRGRQCLRTREEGTDRVVGDSRARACLLELLLLNFVPSDGERVRVWEREGGMVGLRTAVGEWCARQATEPTVVQTDRSRRMKSSEMGAERAT